MFDDRQKSKSDSAEGGAVGELYVADFVVEVEDQLRGLISDIALAAPVREQIESALKGLRDFRGSGRFFKGGEAHQGVLSPVLFEALAKAAEAFDEAGRPALRKTVWNVLAQNLVHEAITLLEHKPGGEAAAAVLRIHYRRIISPPLAPELEEQAQQLGRRHLQDGSVLRAHMLLGGFAHELNYDGDLNLALGLSGLEEPR